MICPFMSKANTEAGLTQVAWVPCREQDCALWLRQDSACAIALSARALSQVVFGDASIRIYTPK